MADIPVTVNVPYLMFSSPSTDSFLSEASGGEHTDLKFSFRTVQKLPELKDIRHEEPRRIYVGEGDAAGTFFRSHPGREPYAFVSRRTVKDGFLFCDYLSGSERFMNYARNLITLLDLETTMLEFDTMILHASLIRWMGRGIVFSAPSGTGKSTQASLWERYAGAEVLNGDRAAIRKKDGFPRAYGIPYAGTSGIYRNESAPLTALVALRQAGENRIRRIHGAEAFRYLYRETMIHRWDPVFEDRAVKLLMDVISEVPVFLLECRPDSGAVETLKTEILSLVHEDP